MRNSEFNHRVNFFPVFIFWHVFFYVSVYQNMAYPPNVSELKLLEVLVKNWKFLDPIINILNRSVWRWHLVICVLNSLPCGFLCILRFEILCLITCLSSSELFYIHFITCVLLHFYMFRVKRFLSACLSFKWKIHVHNTHTKKCEKVNNEPLLHSLVLEYRDVLRPLMYKLIYFRPTIQWGRSCYRLHFVEEAWKMKSIFQIQTARKWWSCLGVWLLTTICRARGYKN